jgi:hypothetical protein
VTGRQTNEAPVKYLLRACPDINEVICIVTQTARQSAWGYFCQTVKQVKPDIRVTDVPFEEGQSFSDGPLETIMQKVEVKDEIFLETTGGFRNAIMHLLLLSRILTYRKISTVAAVYSNFNTAQVEDVSHLIRLFDVVGGMQELTSFGSVRTLREYYGHPAADPAIEELLGSMEELMENITLCRSRLLDEAMQRFNDALENARSSADPMMQQLLPVFREKFKGGKKNGMTTPALIKWCVQSDMLQQALTVYNERIPAYIMQEGIVIYRGTPYKADGRNDYLDAASEQFVRDFMKTSDKVKEERDVCNLGPDSNYEPGKGYTEEKVRTICRDFAYIKAVRNMTNHANHESTKAQQKLMDYLTEFGYPPLERVSSAELKTVILDGLEHLKKGSSKK